MTIRPSYQRNVEPAYGIDRFVASPGLDPGVAMTGEFNPIASCSNNRDGPRMTSTLANMPRRMAEDGERDANRYENLVLAFSRRAERIGLHPLSRSRRTLRHLAARR